MRRRRGLTLLGVLALAAALASAAASADLRRLEVVGAVPAGEDAPPGVVLRDAALAAALREAVQRVALELLDAAPGARVELPAGLLERPTDYAVRYRLREDRGERRALLVNDPDVETEYVVLVEAQVDADRVRRGLREAGLLGGRGTAGASRRLRIEIEGVGSWAVYQQLREALERAGAEGVSPVEFRPGVVVFEVGSGGTAEGLLRGLRARGGMPLRVLAAGPEGLRLRAGGR